MIINFIDLRLATQVALLGNITPCIRAIKIWLKKNTIHMNIFYDGKLSEIDNEAMECIFDHIISNFINEKDDGEILFDLNKVRLDFPKKLPDQGELVYQRMEKA